MTQYSDVLNVCVCIGMGCLNNNTIVEYFALPDAGLLDAFVIYLQLDPLVLVWNYFVIHRIRIYRFREYYCCVDVRLYVPVHACTVLYIHTIFYITNVLVSKLELTILGYDVCGR